MNNIFTINKELQTALAHLDSTGELTDEQAEAIKSLNEKMEDKQKGIIYYYKLKQGEEALIDEEIKRLQALKKSNSKQQANLKKLLELTMNWQNVTEVDFVTHSAKFKKNPPKVVIEDEEAIPKEFIKEKIVTSIDKTAIKNALKDGEVKGAVLVQEERLEIK